MKKLLQINVVVNTGSTGRIAEDIGEIALSKGWRSIIAYGRNSGLSKSELIKVGNKMEIYSHVATTRLFDRHGLGSECGTKSLLKEIEELEPDVIHLHNIHGYYLNFRILFKYLSQKDIPVLWTLHDCWVYTGHCIHYSFISCQKWETKSGCHSCPQKRTYPSSFLIDGSRKNFSLKKSLFTSLPNLTLVPVSKWLERELHKSFLKDEKIKMISNGIDLNQFYPSESESVTEKYNLSEKKFVILGVASTWTETKGLKDFIQLSNLLSIREQIILVGLSEQQLKELPKNIIGLKRTESIDELVELYSRADVFVNPTWEDNYPTTNLEAMACGTPVITYNTGGSTEAISNTTGFVIEQGDINELKRKIDEVQLKGKEYFSEKCRERAETKFNKNDRFKEYFHLYEQLLADERY